MNEKFQSLQTLFMNNLPRNVHVNMGMKNVSIVIMIYFGTAF